MRRLPEVTSAILTSCGAVMEEKDGDRIEFLATKELSEKLNIPEYGTLEFTPNASGEKSITASYDSDFFKSIEGLFTVKGRTIAVTYPTHKYHVEKLTKTVAKKMPFSNATFRFKNTENKTIRYTLFCFKYIAISDERKEGMLSLILNEVNNSIMISGKDIDEILEKLKESDIKSEKLEKSIELLQSACSAAAMITKEKLSDFIKSLERRLNLDIKKGHEYYEILKEETRKAIEKKVVSDGLSSVEAKNIRRQLEKDSETNVENIKKIRAKDINGVNKLLDKLEAIDGEQKWKIHDLTSKYALSIQIDPISIINIETKSTIFWINIKRRLLTREFPLTYNPITRKIDPLPCESCFYPSGTYYVCDKKLHIVCSNCFKKCPHCEKYYCKACYKNKCPKCKK